MPPPVIKKRGFSLNAGRSRTRSKKISGHCTPKTGRLPEKIRGAGEKKNEAFCVPPAPHTLIMRAKCLQKQKGHVYRVLQRTEPFTLYSSFARYKVTFTRRSSFSLTSNFAIWQLRSSMKRTICSTRENNCQLSDCRGA